MPANDSALLARWIRDRDAEAFAEIVARHSAMVYATCSRILRDSAEAEDVTQECFLKLATFRKPKRHSLGGLLHTLATREAINRVKVRSRRKKREQRYASNVPDDSSPQWDDTSKLIDEAITQLPERIQQPLVAHFLEGRTQTSIAEELDLDESTIRYRIRKGIAEVRAHLKKRGVTTTTGALAALLSSNASQAAPATLCTTLGKMAIAGAHSAPTAISSATALTTLGGTILMTKKVALVATGIVIIVAAGYGGLALQSRVDKTAAPDLALVESNTDLDTSPPDEFARSTVANNQNDIVAATVEEPEPPLNLIEPESPLGEVITAVGEALGDSGDTPDVEPTSGTSSDVPTENGMHFFLLAAELFDDDDMEFIAETWLEFGLEAWRDPEIQALISAHKAAFDAIRQGLEVGNAMLSLLVDYFNEPMPYLARWRVLAQLMIIEADMKGSQGDYASAFDQYLMLIEFGNESANGGMFLNGLLGYVIRNWSVEALRDAIASQALPAADYAGLIEELIVLDDETFALILGETENMDLWLNATDDPMRELLQLAEVIGGPIDISVYSEAQLAALWQEFLEHREIRLAYSEMPFHELQSIDFYAIYGMNPFSLSILSTYDSMAAFTAYTRAQVLGTALVAAIEWYRGDEGIYPTSLSQLSPKYIPTIPVDPFTGKGFLFDSRDSGYLLYSTGRDMTDDGGKPSRQGIPRQNLLGEDGKDVMLHDF